LKVEVEAAKIAELEQQLANCVQWLRVSLSKRKGKTLTVTPGDLDTSEGGNVRFEVVDDGIILTYEAP